MKNLPHKKSIPLLKTIACCIIFLSVSIAAYGDIRLPALISDGMVLQRNAKVIIWGWAGSGEKINMSFLNTIYHTTANEKGEWVITLSGLNAGGPYTMTLHGSNIVIVKNIVIGDVWVCSGQSNMELPMRRVSPLYEAEISGAENPFIRQFAVPQRYNFNAPQADLELGSWQQADPKTILSFSAVAYFFAKELYEQYHVPIGLINASLGGSPAEAWMSEEALKQFPEKYNEAQRFKDQSLIDSIEHSDRQRMKAWYELLEQKDEGYKDPSGPWYNPAINASNWDHMKIPGYWTGESLEKFDGVIWFRKEINIPVSMTGKPAKLILGRIVDADSVFINGVFVGTTSYQYPPRRYDLPDNLLKEGKNILVARVINNIGPGGFIPDKPYEIIAGQEKLDLKGDWQYRIGASMEPLRGETFIRWKPLGLYNGMISPLLNYSIKGAIWYQGESNTGRPLEYRNLLPALIRDWRNSWNQGNFPFLYVQLANFMKAKDQPSESQWALLREAQLKTLSVPNTAMTVIIDVGEWNDIHPLNKKDVGKRLALSARKVAYGEDQIVHSGPLYQSMSVEDNRVILSFSSIGSGLQAKGGELKGFAIAGVDRQFVWAKAKIDHDRLIVWSEKVPEPIAVRYAWADNPEGANLYNLEGLPASPFRTDEF
ncbi:MAG: sialate O-acetylesterase [Bacteroidales bacterium]|nr:sialate O-acetylesterase [Bacteroidales bacterium]